jgi:6-phosphogluconolactonase
MPDLIISEDLESLSHLAAEAAADVVSAAVAARGRGAVALSGGSTPQRLYALLAAAPWRESLPWGALQVYWSDERLVPPDHPESNVGAARAPLLDRVPIPVDRVHAPPVGEAPDRAAALYEATIRRELGEPPRFDLILLGMGPDGHTASLFPGSPELEERERLVVATAAPHNGVRRLTFTLPLINTARDVLFLVAGADKRPALARVLAGDRDLPAARVAPADGRLRWLIDRAAAPA